MNSVKYTRTACEFTMTQLSAIAVSDLGEMQEEVVDRRRTVAGEATIAEPRGRRPSLIPWYPPLQPSPPARWPGILAPSTIHRLV